MKIAFICGSGLQDSIANKLVDSAPKRVRNIFDPKGSNSGELISYTVGKQSFLEVVVLSRHNSTGQFKTPGELVKYNLFEGHIHALAEEKVDAIFAFSAVGVSPGDVPLVVNETNSKYSFIVPDGYGRGFGIPVHTFGAKYSKDIHPNMAEPLSEELRKRAIDAVGLARCDVKNDGMYIYNGPDGFETPDEVKALDNLYSHRDLRAYGMTAGPEIQLSKQKRIPYAVVCANVNPAEGTNPDFKVTHENTIAMIKKAEDKFNNIAMNIIRTYVDIK